MSKHRDTEDTEKANWDNTRRLFGWTLVPSCATIRGIRTNPQALESC